MSSEVINWLLRGWNRIFDVYQKTQLRIGELLFILCSERLFETFIAGGIVLSPAYYGMPGHTDTMIHEVGHVLGLYHVFKGVSERESCSDPCKETVPSMETGDLCADTAPTPKSELCREPEAMSDTCGFTRFPGAPFTNYMSYTGITTVLLCFLLRIHGGLWELGGWRCGSWWENE